MVKNGKLQREGTQRLPEYARQISQLERAMASKRQVMNSEFTASIAVAQDRQIYESGHSEYFITGQQQVLEVRLRRRDCRYQPAVFAGHQARRSRAGTST